MKRFRPLSPILACLRAAPLRAAPPAGEGSSTTAAAHSSKASSQSLHSSGIFDRLRSNMRFVIWAVVLLLAIHAGMLAYSATKHSPTMLEPAFLVAGLSHWEFGRFELFRVNPPLVRMVAALPVMAAGYEMDWSGFYDGPGARPEFSMGADFIKANGERSIWLFTIARWACIPFSLIGALFCFFWSRELWGHNGAGLISLILWCFEPNILAHGELITTDCAATSFGVGAGYFFWRWLKKRTWERAGLAGLLFGLAQLSKLSWLFLYGLWPVLWLFWMWSEHRDMQRSDSNNSPCPSGDRLSRRDIFVADENRVRGKPRLAFIASGLQLASILLLGLYLTNLAYGFSESGTRLGEFEFVSHFLGGKKPGEAGNRFADSMLKDIPVPLPSQYVLGFDLQKKDFEDFGQPSYLRGEWKDGGWWYYYIYGLAVKTPHGSQLMLLLAIVTLVALRRRRVESGAAWRDLIVLFTPAVVVLVLVSAQLEFNHHVRYVLPVLGFAFVFSGITTSWFAAAVRRSFSVRARTPLPENEVESRGQRSVPPFSKKQGDSIDTALQDPAIVSSSSTSTVRLSSFVLFRFLKRVTLSQFRGEMSPMAVCCRVLIFASLLATIASTLRVYPHQLAYFNELSGGPENGYKHLLGSNLDWGQDLLFAESWMKDHGVQPRNVRLISNGILSVYGQQILQTQVTRNAVDWEIVSGNAAFGLHALPDAMAFRTRAPRLGYSGWIVPVEQSDRCVLGDVPTSNVPSGGS